MFIKIAITIRQKGNKVPAVGAHGKCLTVGEWLWEATVSDTDAGEREREMLWRE